MTYAAFGNNQMLCSDPATREVRRFLTELGKRWEEILEFLGDKPFLFADRPSAADLAIFGQASMQRSGPTPQAEELIAERPALVDYLARVDAATAA